MAWFSFERFFPHRCPWNISPKDLLQEAVLRLVEVGGGGPGGREDAMPRSSRQHLPSNHL
jgi:hypothetical protein